MTAGTGSWSGTRRSFPAATRRRILNRDRWTCQLRYAGCQGHAPIADHIVPAAEGGSDNATNGQAVCATCHTIKTRQEQARGRARKPSRLRQPEQHPGRLR
jgi:5-methylcytosine-specific restriction protein A